ncbi:MAG: glutamine synthetase family protein [Ignavibacteriaceae bacterium]
MKNDIKTPLPTKNFVLSTEPNHLLKLFEEQKIKRIKVGGFDIDGVLRGKYISLKKFSNILDKGSGLCDVIFGWDISDKLYEEGKFTGWQTGYPDLIAKIDLSSFRQIPWEENTPFFLLDFYTKNGDPLVISPRYILRKACEELEKENFNIKHSVEYEYFIFQETPKSVMNKKFSDLNTLSSGMFGYSALKLGTHSSLMKQIWNLLKDFNIPLEGHHTETGPGVYESAIEYDEGLNAGDKAALFKNSVKEIVSQNNLMATFMAKWNPNLPGCSGHIHQSVWSSDGNNHFFQTNHLDSINDLMKQFIAGQLNIMPELAVLSCPTINSYKRLQQNTWAPTNISWGIENRTCAIRIASPNNYKSQRIEYRLPGADACPYISMSAAIYSGMHGIKNKFELTEPCIGSAYDVKDYKKLPGNLEEATTLFYKSEIARHLFGDFFVEHYAMTRRREIEQFNKTVTNWELERYFEII